MNTSPGSSMPTGAILVRIKFLHFSMIANNCVGATVTGVFNQRRTQYLASGSVVWDFGGNAAQWINYNDTNKPTLNTPSIIQWQEFVAVTGSATTPLSALVPRQSLQNWWNDGWGSTQGVGMIEVGPVGYGGAMVRGGGYASGTDAGLFSVSLAHNASDVDGSIGFRCAWKP